MGTTEILITAGVVAVLGSVVGGGLKGFGVEVPLLASVRRQMVLLAVGVALLGLGLFGGQLQPGDGGKADGAAATADKGEGNAAASSAAAAPAAASPGRPEMPNIVGLPFAAARQFLVQNAWGPINSPSSPMANDEALGFRGQELMEAGYREAVACSGSALAPCIFRYRHPTGAILEVVAVGEDVRQAIVNDARILDCKAEPKPEGCAW